MKGGDAMYMYTTASSNYDIGYRARKFIYDYRWVISALIACTVFFVMVCPVFAAPAGGSSDTLWSIAPQFSANLVKQLKALYCKSIFPPLAIITAISMALTKDERTLATLKKALITEIVVFFLIFLADIGINTAASLFEGPNINTSGFY